MSTPGRKIISHITNPIYKITALNSKAIRIRPGDQEISDTEAILNHGKKKVEPKIKGKGHITSFCSFFDINLFDSVKKDPLKYKGTQEDIDLALIDASNSYERMDYFVPV